MKLLFLFAASVAFCNPDPWEGHFPPEEFSEQIQDDLPDRSDLFNLDQFNQDFVLESRQIQIPGFDLAFNPGIVKWNGSTLMSFRVRDENGISIFKIGLVWLDHHFEPIGTPQVIEIPPTAVSSVIKFQDPRLVVVDKHLYIIFSNILDQKPGEREQRKMFFSELTLDHHGFHVTPPYYLTNFEGEKPQRWEKNWPPFDYQGNLLFAYDIQPHRILLPNFEQNRCDTIASTCIDFIWNWGSLRGGTPPLLEGDEYLGFFHSCKNMATKQSKGQNITHYFFGAYTFSKEPPFNITKISPEPISSRHFYRGHTHNTWKPLRVIFPCGHISDKNYIWLSHGKQDHECWITKIDKKKLLKSLVPVATK
jgi:predicted GH43/DUF377 family glycosyl hydrolase